ncbi:MAG: hypothetical protein LBG81_02270 [Coriobacteriaceae bacterium]|nr:hypothetical protein [Coriobacteriaceae bacterium]
MFKKSAEQHIIVEADKLASRKESFDALSWGRVAQIAKRLQGASREKDREALANELLAISQANTSLLGKLGMGAAVQHDQYEPSRNGNADTSPGMPALTSSDPGQPPLGAAYPAQAPRETLVPETAPYASASAASVPLGASPRETAPSGGNHPVVGDAFSNRERPRPSGAVAEEAPTASRQASGAPSAASRPGYAQPVPSQPTAVFAAAHEAAAHEAAAHEAAAHEAAAHQAAVHQAAGAQANPALHAQTAAQLAATLPLMIKPDAQDLIQGVTYSVSTHSVSVQAAESQVTIARASAASPSGAPAAAPQSAKVPGIAAQPLAFSGIDSAQTNTQTAAIKTAPVAFAQAAALRPVQTASVQPAAQKPAPAASAHLAAGKPVQAAQAAAAQPAAAKPAPSASAHPAAAKPAQGAPAQAAQDRQQAVRVPLKGAFARFRHIYESRDGSLCIFEDSEGHIVAVDASKLA